MIKKIGRTPRHYGSPRVDEEEQKTIEQVLVEAKKAHA